MDGDYREGEFVAADGAAVRVWCARGLWSYRRGWRAGGAACVEVGPLTPAVWTGLRRASEPPPPRRVAHAPRGVNHPPG